ncbi:MAG: glycerate kinase type-2 family protein [Candidatus Bathyarchaeia archaeon]
MRGLIRNREQLVSHGNVRGREVALNIIEYALEAVDSYKATMRRVKVEDDKLNVDGSKYDLAMIKRIFVVGAGKATFPIAQALEEVLEDRIWKGLIIVKRGESRRLKRIQVVEASHPLPDEAGLEGAWKTVRIVEEAQSGDLVFCAVTGGASALMPMPAGDITLEDKRVTTELLLKSGAKIDEVNAVRNHISKIKGGRLAYYIHPAQMINLIVIDEVAGQPWGPTVPDQTTFQDAARVLEKYSLWDKVPMSVREYIEKGLRDPRLETPKTRDFKNLKVQNVILADNESLCKAAERKARDLGFRSMIISTLLEGESREVGSVLAGIAKEVDLKARPLKPPCVLITGGESTVSVRDECGLGGPSQELVLGASLKIAGNRRIVIASIDTDGTDGPTDVAGGLVDGYTFSRAEEAGLDIFEGLMKHNSCEVLTRLQDTIITGPTGTNVMDLNLIVVTRKP